jgi:hypothetical protein
MLGGKKDEMRRVKRDKRKGRREKWREGGRERGREEGREGGREGGREEGREGGREGGKKGGGEGGREGGREGRRVHERTSHVLLVLDPRLPPHHLHALLPLSSPPFSASSSTFPLFSIAPICISPPHFPAVRPPPISSLLLHQWNCDHALPLYRSSHGFFGLFIYLLGPCLAVVERGGNGASDPTWGCPGGHDAGGERVYT